MQMAEWSDDLNHTQLSRKGGGGGGEDCRKGQHLHFVNVTAKLLGFTRARVRNGDFSTYM